MQDRRIRNIKAKLDTWGIKRQWLADKLEVNKSHLSMWLNGTVDMPEDKIKEAEKCLGQIPEPQ